MKFRNVLVVDDEPNMRRVLQIMLGRMGMQISTAADGREALELLQQQPFDLLMTDLRMPGIDGIELLRGLRERGLTLPVILMTAHGSIESAIAAMQLGACDYLLRPFDMEVLQLAIQRIAVQGQLLSRNAFLNEEIARSDTGLVGSSAAIGNVSRQIEQVAPTQATVLISGETGTGKEVVARAIHRASVRRDALFVPINCAAIPADILESELFGHERGAFSGAVKDRIGKFELADGGTLFLDEITEMPAALQAKLLRVLQESTVERLGSNRTLQLDLRVIAATNRPALAAVREGVLREDLYYRLNVFALELPPLRERREDISQLARHFIAQCAPGARPPAISDAALDHLTAYDWPGNVRELRNLIERALVLSGGQTLDIQHFPLQRAESTQISSSGPSLAGPLDMTAATAALEADYIREALRRSDGNKTKAAAMLDLSERTIWYKIKKYGLEKN